MRLDGKPVALDMKSRARDELAHLRRDLHVDPALAVVIAGADPTAVAYQRSIVRAAKSVGMRAEVVDLPDTVDQRTIHSTIDQLNNSADIHGVIILQPMPEQISRIDVADTLDPLKDIDGITTFNAGRLSHDDFDVLAPSTPAGGMALLKYYEIPIASKHAVVVGRSPVVGKPMALMLLAENATVTICHSRTNDLARYTQQADILVAAAGSPGMIHGDMVKPGATVVDFGVSFQEDRMLGDVDYASVVPVASGVTPVPGGTGRVTTMVLIRNTLKAAQLQHRKSRIGS